MNDHCPHVSPYGYRAECSQCRAAREAREHAEHVAAAEEWFARTGICHDCGQPAAWCQCSSECGCARLHVVGAGVGRDPADVFAETPAPVDQDGLF